MGRFVSATGQFLLATYGQFPCSSAGSFRCPLTFEITNDLPDDFSSSTQLLPTTSPG